MATQKLDERGIANVQDAIFVKDFFIPKARKEERWNVVVFETYRVTELLLKGMVCLSGHSPIRSHELDDVLDDFIEKVSYLADSKEHFPFFYALHEPGGISLYVTIAPLDQVRLYMKKDNVYSEIASGDIGSLSLDDILAFKIVISGDDCKLYLKDKVILSSFYKPSSDSVSIERKFKKDPDSQRLRDLKEAVRNLRASRENSFYSEHFYSREDALSKLDLMNKVFDYKDVFIKTDFL